MAAASGAAVDAAAPVALPGDAVAAAPSGTGARERVLRLGPGVVAGMGGDGARAVKCGVVRRAHGAVWIDNRQMRVRCRVRCSAGCVCSRARWTRLVSPVPASARAGRLLSLATAFHRARGLPSMSHADCHSSRSDRLLPLTGCPQYVAAQEEAVIGVVTGTPRDEYSVDIGASGPAL